VTRRIAGHEHGRKEENFLTETSRWQAGGPEAWTRDARKSWSPSRMLNLECSLLRMIPEEQWCKGGHARPRTVRATGLALLLSRGSSWLLGAALCVDEDICTFANELALQLLDESAHTRRARGRTAVRPADARQPVRAEDYFSRSPQSNSGVATSSVRRSTAQWSRRRCAPRRLPALPPTLHAAQSATTKAGAKTAGASGALALYTHKILQLGQKLPLWVRKVLGEEALALHMQTWVEGSVMKSVYSVRRVCRARVLLTPPRKVPSSNGRVNVTVDTLVVPNDRGQQSNVSAVVHRVCAPTALRVGAGTAGGGSAAKAGADCGYDPRVEVSRASRERAPRRPLPTAVLPAQERAY
jgi:hypothetical protein